MRILSLLLCPLVILNPLWAQSNATASADPTPEPTLHVHVVDDPGQVQTQTTSAKGYVLQVTDFSGAPVAGAAVALRLPEGGPTGLFENGLRAWVAYSDAAGVAHFPVIRWGDHTGPVELRVTVAKGTFHTGLIIPQQIDAGNPVSVSVVSVPIRAPSMGSPAVRKPASLAPPEVAVNMPQPDQVSQALADVIPADVTPPNISHSGVSPANGKPRKLTPNLSQPSEPAVSVTNYDTGASGSHDSHKKLWILLAVGAGAGAGAMMALKGHSSGTSTTSTSGVSVGTPTISLGH